MEQITIQIPADDYKELVRQAAENFRTPAEQARSLVHMSTSPAPAAGTEGKLSHRDHKEKMAAAQPMFNALRRLRQEAGSPSVRKVSELTGGAVSPTTIYGVLRGHQMPSVPVLDEMVTALGGDAEYFRRLRGW